MRKYASIQNVKINKHFHTKHGKNTSTQDRSLAMLCMKMFVCLFVVSVVFEKRKPLSKG